MSHSLRFLRAFLASVTLLGIAAHAAGLTQSCSAPQFPGAATAIDSACGVAGTGGTETNQNTAKNNFCAPGPAKPITIAAMVTLQNNTQAIKDINFGNSDKHPLTLKPGPLVNRSAVVAQGEGKQVVLQGFVLTARQEGAESVNCEKKVADAASNHDIHISIVDAANNTNECSGVVVEMTPHHRPASWTAANVQSVAEKHLPVRVTGQLMFDSSHTPCIGGTVVSGDPKRSSLWEVHPIYKFEVCPSGHCTDSGWQTLENWVATGANAHHK